MSTSPWLQRSFGARAPPLEGDQRADWVVVGGGVAGVFAARALRQGGASVVLVEAGRLAHGASGRNAGFLLAEGSESHAAVAREHGPLVARSLRALGLETRSVVRDLARRHDVGLEIVGSLRLAADDEEAEDLRRSADLLEEDLCWIGPDDLPPVWQGRGFCGGLEDAGDGLLDPVRLVHAAWEEARIDGARLCEETRVLFLDHDRHGVSAKGARGRVFADGAVVATNAAANSILRPQIGPHPVRAQALLAEVQPAPPWRQAVYARRGADYWRPMPGGRVLVGGRRSRGGRREETDTGRPTARVQGALDALLGQLLGAGIRHRVLARWAGTMGFTPDGLPLLGPLEEGGRIHALLGWNGHGMGWAPGAATAWAQGVLGRGPGTDPLFSPRRRAVLRRLPG